MPSFHYSDVIMIACWAVCSGANQRNHQSSASPSFVRKIYRWPVDSPRKWPVMQKMFPFDDVTMIPHLGRLLPLPLQSWHGNANTVKPVYNDHLMGYFSAFWNPIVNTGVYYNHTRWKIPFVIFSSVTQLSNAYPFTHIDVYPGGWMC